MPKGSISDEEIALIKAMLNRGMKNNEIQFFFNRPERTVNSGRITGIKQGSYGNSANIVAATDTVLDTFLTRFPSTNSIGFVKIPLLGKIPSQVYGPVDVETLSAMFHQDAAGVWRFKHGETDQHECKENFGFKHGDQWLRAIAALANNRGGYIFLGVMDKDANPIDGLDKSYAVVGMKDTAFQDADPADFAKKIKSTLDPTPRYQTATIQIDGKSIGVIYVEQHPSRPVIASCSINDKFKEGDIYFRYTGQSVRIKYSDLRSILDARDLQSRQQILPMVERLLALGPAKALIADLEQGTLGDGNQQIVIDEALLERIKFIREGDFTQKDGAAALKLVGEIAPFSSNTSQQIKLIRDKVGEGDILRNFLQHQTVQLPEAYIQQGIDLQRKWLPIFYYVKQMGVSAAELADKLANEKTSHAVKRDEMVKRLRGKLSAKPKQIATKHLKSLAVGIEKGKLPDFKTCKEALGFVDALACISKTSLPLMDILKAVQVAQEIIESGEPKSIGRVYKAACRIDEIFFA